MNQILIVLYPGAIEFEVLLAAELLSERFPVRVTTPDGGDHVSRTGLKIKADFPYRDVQTEDFRVILVPGGDPGSVAGNPDLNRLIHSADQHELIIGAVCAGPFVLAQAGILKGIRIAHGYEPGQLAFLSNYFDGVNVTDALLAEDGRNGRIITAKPNAFIDFAIRIAMKAGVITEPTRAEELRTYYRGIKI